MKRLLIGVTLVCALSGCASTGTTLKQHAVPSLAISETALEASHDAERLVCSPTANQAAAIAHCDGPFPALTDARHLQLAQLYSQAFAVEKLAASALQKWHPGDPAPSSLADYQVIVADILQLAGQLIPKTQATVTKAQDAVNTAADVAKALGAK